MSDVSLLSGKEAAVFAEDCAALHTAGFSAFGARVWSVTEMADLLLRETTVLCRTSEGFLIGQITEYEAEILTFAVGPEQQGKGLGGKILEYFLQECSCRKVSKCILEVAVDNVAAIALYDKFDFKMVGVRKKYFKRSTGSISALTMEKVLPSPQ